MKKIINVAGIISMFLLIYILIEIVIMVMPDSVINKKLVISTKRGYDVVVQENQSRNINLVSRDKLNTLFKSPIGKRITSVEVAEAGHLVIKYDDLRVSEIISAVYVKKE